MHTQHAFWIAFAVALVVTAPALGDAPQLTVQAAHYMMNSYGENWDCSDPLSDPQGNCKSNPNYVPASYTFAHHMYPTELWSGYYVALVDGGSRDGGWTSNDPSGVGDNIATFFLAGPQGGTHTLGQTLIEDDAKFGCTHDNGVNAACHWEPADTLYSSSYGAMYVFQELFSSGNIAQAKYNWFLLGESFDGISNWDWTQVFRSDRPQGQVSGSYHLFNKFRAVVDPNDPLRWIGTMSWSFNDGVTKDSGTTPFYLDVSGPPRFGVLFANEGWCEMPLGQHWTSYNPSDTCADLQAGGVAAIPDKFYDMGIGKNNQDLALIDGKVILLQVVTKNGTNNQRCDNYASYIDPDTGFPYTSEAACAYDHAPCPPGYDRNLYVQRRDNDNFDGSRSWRIRELGLNTWNTSFSQHFWVGGFKTIKDGGQALAFKIEPTDLVSTGSYHGGTLKQYSNGTVYLYLSIKHSLCQPSETGLAGAFRFPVNTSGTSMVWLRLN